MMVSHTWQAVRKNDTTSAYINRGQDILVTVKPLLYHFSSSNIYTNLERLHL